MTFTTLGDATAISTILSNTNTLSDIHTDIAHNHTDISTMQGNVTTILGTTNTLSDIHTDVGSAIADIAAVHTHVHSLPTSFVTSGAASVQRGSGYFSSAVGGLSISVTISAVNMSKSFVIASHSGSPYSALSIKAIITSPTTISIVSYNNSSIDYSWEVITFA